MSHLKTAPMYKFNPLVIHVKHRDGRLL